MSATSRHRRRVPEDPASPAGLAHLWHWETHEVWKLRVAGVQVAIGDRTPWSWSWGVPQGSASASPAATSIVTAPDAVLVGGAEHWL